MAGPFPADIWHIIASDFILSSTTLSNLCLVSRSLNEIFTPIFFRDILLVEKHQYSGVIELPLQRLADLSAERCLSFIRTLKLPHKLHKEEHWDALRKLLDKTSGLKDCSVRCEPINMEKFDLASIINDIEIAPTARDWRGRYIATPISWNRMPKYRNLRHLTLYSMSPEAPSLLTNIAKVLIASPGLKTLGFGLDQEGPAYRGVFDFLSELAIQFEKYGEPGTRLKIEDLRLGYRASNPHAQGYVSDALSRLTDLSKLKRFSHMNQSRPEDRGEEKSVENLNYEILLQATNLASVSAYFCTKGLVALVEQLSRHEPRALRDLVVHTIDTKWSRSPSYDHLDNLGGSWRKIHVGGNTSVERDSNLDDVCKHFVAQSYDFIEDFGAYSGHWCRMRDDLSKYTNLRRLFLVQMYWFSSDALGAIRKTKFAAEIFHYHRTEMQKKGLISKLKYIGLGIDRTVYTIMWPGESKPGIDGLTRDLAHLNSPEEIDTNDYQIIALSPEEAETFHAFVPGRL